MKESALKAGKSIWNSLPVLAGIILLISLANTVIPKSSYSVLFNKFPLLDSIIGSIIGSILAGNPINSYIIGGELLNQGVSLIAVTSFIVAWVSVGIIQLPAESMLLGKKFAIIRNIVSFILSIIVAFVTVIILGLL
ncbi:MAG: hypothetical protein J7K26_00705 [Candidatus Aenigmarchaeota archaeon]|nr:hypothetical protein [Candidatus Aenigmarchaeota archaeon]